MYFNSLFLVMQLIFITIGLRNGLVQGLDIGGNPVPDECICGCTAASELYDSCAPLQDDFLALIACVCTPEGDMAIQQCLNCVVPIDPSFENSFQMDLDDYNAVCDGLPPLTYPPIPAPTPFSCS